jgi:hypothetical protein
MPVIRCSDMIASAVSSPPHHLVIFTTTINTNSRADIQMTSSLPPEPRTIRCLHCGKYGHTCCGAEAARSAPYIYFIGFMITTILLLIIIIIIPP